jgi:3-methyladenine DNA glycosylase AlkD
MTAAELLQLIDGLASDTVRKSMQRFGIDTTNARGITTPVLKQIARKIGPNHRLAAQLWATGVFEARVIAAFVAEPAQVSPAQMERWVGDFDSWAICDACCCYVFRRTPHAWKKAVTWSARKGEFVKRAGFALMAYLAVHDRQAEDARFVALLPTIERESSDNRPFVRKAVNWALRQIGKRNSRLNARAIEAGERIRKNGTPAGRWIAADALRELRGDQVQARLLRKAAKSRPALQQA